MQRHKIEIHMSDKELGWRTCEKPLTTQQGEMKKIHLKMGKEYFQQLFLRFGGKHLIPLHSRVLT